MIEITGNIFDIPDADAICVTTNGVVKTNGALVMDKGLALEFANRWPQLPMLLGTHVKQYGNVPTWFDRHDLYCLSPKCVISFPTKHEWSRPSDLKLIEQSAHSIVGLVNFLKLRKIVLTRPGCGLGGLDWETQVKPLLEPILDDRFYIITPQ